MKTAQAEPREFYIQKTLVTVGAKVEAMYKVYLQMPDNAASNEYNHGDIYFHVIEISAVEALESQNSILKQQIAELNEDIRQDYIDSATRERELVKKLDDMSQNCISLFLHEQRMSQVGIRNLELEADNEKLKLAIRKLNKEIEVLRHEFQKLIMNYYFMKKDADIFVKYVEAEITKAIEGLK